MEATHWNATRGRTLFVAIITALLVFAAEGLLGGLYLALAYSLTPESHGTRAVVVKGAFGGLILIGVMVLVLAPVLLSRRLRASPLPAILIAAVILGALAQFTLVPILSSMNSCRLGVRFPTDTQACR